MKCLDCRLKYIGQTERAFNITYKEQIHAIRSNNSNSGYSNHILNTRHTYGTVTDTMDVIRIGRKGRYLNTLEKYHIYEISRNNLHMNETHIELYNPILERVHEIYNR
jgi:PP-loop superfamily ATP-utilizing enzyme